MQCFPSADRKERFFFGLCATVLAFMNPVLLQQIGSSFADITTTVLVLGGWLLLVQAVLRPRTKLVIFAAMLLGIATALKPTNGVYAVAAFFLVAFLPLPFLGRIRNLLYFGATLAASFVLTAAPWSYQLARMFGNPMFPLLNNVFKSPEIPIASTEDLPLYTRFIDRRPSAPVRNDRYDSMIDEELVVPGHSLRPVAASLSDIRDRLGMAVEQTCFDSRRNCASKSGDPRARWLLGADSSSIGSYG